MTSILHTRNGRFVDKGAELSALLDRLAADPDPRLLLHVHGGLVSESDALRIAYRLDGRQSSTEPSYVPLKSLGWQTSYLVWESSLGETIANNHAALSRSPLLVRYILRVAAWVEGRGWESLATQDQDLSAVLGRLDREPLPPEQLFNLIGPDATKVEEADELDTDQLLDTDLGRQLLEDPEINRLHTEVVRTRGAGIPGSDIDPEHLAQVAARTGHPSSLLPSTRESSPADFVLVPLAVLAGLRAVKRLVTGRDHGVYCTIVEEIGRALFLARCGSAAWTLMKGDAADHFNGEGAAGDLLLRGVAEIARSRPVRILLVGHSAGAVFGCHFAARAANLPENVTVDYAFLNPAVRIDLTASLLVDAPRKLNNIRIFTMTDEREKRDNLDDTPFGKIYPRSLLYLISGVLEFLPNTERRTYPDAPISGLQRHLGRQAALTSTERASRDRLLALIEQQIVYSGIDGGPGRQCDARTHGSIDGDAHTISSIIHVASHGY